MRRLPLSPPILTTLSAKHRRDAFSLVEVVLAVGVISFSMISVLGVMPVGMTAMRSANDDTTQSQILKQISARISMTNFASVGTSFDNKKFYFNESGDAQTADDSNTRFRVTTSVGSPLFPGSDLAPNTGQAAINSQFAVVKISLVTSATASAVTKETKKFTVQVANLGG